MVAADNSWFCRPCKSSQKSDSIGIVSFEVASLISKVIQLWKFLKDGDYENIMNSIGIRKLVSNDDDYILGLIYAEVMDNFHQSSRIVARLAQKCSNPRLKSLENRFYERLTMKKIGNKKIEEVEDLLSTNELLYAEMQALLELKKTIQTKKIRTVANLVEFEQKIAIKEREIDHLKNVSSIWNSIYDDTVLLLVRFLHATFYKIELVFGVVNASDPGFTINSRAQSILNSKANRRISLEPLSRFFGGYSRYKRMWIFISGNRLQNAPEGTLVSSGGSNLVRCYANTIIQIEKLVALPELICNRAVNVMKAGLPGNVRYAVQERLKFRKIQHDLSTCVAEWTRIRTEILDWLAPFAHNTVKKWQSDQKGAHLNLVHSREKLIPSVQTLYFANLGKIEEVMIDVFVGLTGIAQESSRRREEDLAKFREESGCGGSSHHFSELDHILRSSASDSYKQVHGSLREMVLDPVRFKKSASLKSFQ